MKWTKDMAPRYLAKPMDCPRRGVIKTEELLRVERIGVADSVLRASIEAGLRNVGVINTENDREIRMQCADCGKRFWVQIGTVACNIKQSRLTKCSACAGEMCAVVREEA